MPLVPAKCTQCGSTLTIEPSQDAAICPFCNTPFVTEKAINNYNTTNNISADVVNIYQSKESDFVIRGGVLEEYCGEGTEVYIPDNVIEIKREVFKGCSGITKVVIPQSVKIIGWEVFKDCISLECTNLPEGIEEIPYGLFYNCVALKYVNIPNTVTRIGRYSFSRCESLSSICIPQNVREIGAGAFYGCKKINEVNIPRGIKIIEAGIFRGCASLINITIPDGVERIEEGAFMDCESLKSVNIPTTVKTITNYYDDGDGYERYSAFENCHKLCLINGKDDPYEFLCDRFNFSSFHETPIIDILKKHTVWYGQGKCRYCGGSFKGFFKQVCKNCGRVKK